jgi:uracil-DNA glycosylase
MNLINEWQTVLADCIGSGRVKRLGEKVNIEYRTHKCYPPGDLVFNALNTVPPEAVRVVILGQDPYHGAGQAMGLAFSVDPKSVQNGANFPPSLSNIIKEVKDEFGSCSVESGDLTAWAKQGVLLLNTCLSVRAGQPLSHKDLGWEYFIEPIIEYLNTRSGIVFVLWGSNAKKYKDMLFNPENLVLTAAHPSPLSANNGFFGCNHFKQINEFLSANGQKEILW